MIVRVSHVTHAVRSLTEASPIYRDLYGLKEGPETYFPRTGVKAKYFGLGNSFFELFEPVDPQCPVGRFLEKRGEGLFHVALAVDDLDATIAEWKAKGARVDVQEAGDNIPYKSAWVHPSATKGILIQLVTDREIMVFVRKEL